VIDGVAEVIATTEKVRRPRVALPDVRLHEHGVLFRDLLLRAKALEPARMAVVHPVDRDSLLGAVQAAQEGLIVPVLIGPEARIRSVAEAHETAIADLELIATEHSHEAPRRAVELARHGQVQAPMKGAIGTEELMHAAVVPAKGC
jgi:phosphate acetyltransferase